MRAQQAIEKCPGEKKCQDWEAAAGSTHAEKEQNACFGCHLFKTKYDGTEEDAINEIVDTVERLRNEQRAGMTPNLKTFSPVVWEGLIIWHREESQMEIEYKTKINQIFEALLAFRL